MADPNRWQPLALDLIVTQNGIPLPDRCRPSSAPAGSGVTPFALTRAAPPPTSISTRVRHRCSADRPTRSSRTRIVNMLELAAQLTPDDGVRIDISPASWGNNPLGTQRRPRLSR